MHRAAESLSIVSQCMCFAGAAIIALLPFPIIYEIVLDKLHRPPDWVFEISGYAMIAVALAASGYGLRTGHHFRVTLLLDAFPRVAPFLDRVSGLLQFVFGIVLTVAGWDQAYSSLLQDLRSATLLGVPQFWPQLALPIGGAVIALQGLATLLSPNVRRGFRES
ncbi:MAG: TRAP transporter small permease [Vulcanimicrobiaceae bacterium]